MCERLLVCLKDFESAMLVLEASPQSCSAMRLFIENICLYFLSSRPPLTTYQLLPDICQRHQAPSPSCLIGLPSWNSLLPASSSRTHFLALRHVCTLEYGAQVMKHLGLAQTELVPFNIICTPKASKAHSIWRYCDHIYLAIESFLKKKTCA